MADTTISAAASLTRSTIATGDLIPVLDISAAPGSKASSITKEELAAALLDSYLLPLAGGTMDENAVVNLFNGSKWQQSTPDKGIAGTAGFSVICSAGYEYKFALGFLFILSDGSSTVRKVLYAPAAPTATDDTTLGFTTDTTWEMADGTQYRCTDVTEGAAVWAVVPGSAFDPAAPGPLGDTTPDVVNTTELNVKDSGGTTTASIDGIEGTASFASGGLAIDQYGNITSNDYAEATLFNFNAQNQVNVGYGSNAGTLNVKDSGGTTTASISGADGSASFASGGLAIDQYGNITTNSGATATLSTLTLTGTLIGGTQSLTTAGGAGAVNLTALTTEVETTGILDALTLANGTVGQIKIIAHTVGAFTSVLTPTTAVGFTTITFLAGLGQTCTLEYTTAGWVILAVGGLTLPVIA